MPLHLFRLRLDIVRGRMLLILGPGSMRFFMTRLIATTAMTRPVRVLDAGGQLEASLLHQLTARRRESLKPIERIQVRTCRRLYTLLEEATVQSNPLFVLDLLRPFYDTGACIPDKLQLLDGCLEQLKRLKPGGGAVSLCPPDKRLEFARSLLREVESRAPEIFTAEVTFPDRELEKLYARRRN